jgi:eukaryotic-like serine/threonine-protein kinase
MSGEKTSDVDAAEMSGEKTSDVDAAEMSGEKTSDVDAADSFLRAVAAVSESEGIERPTLRLSAGAVLSQRFVVERLASSGGMGAVYQATDRATGAPVAVKVMARHSVQDSARFAREAIVLAELSHPAIVRYIDHGTSGDTPFLVMEWLEGEDLSRRLQQSGLGADESLGLVRRACEGMAIAHARGVVHRDLKPSNIFLVGGDALSTKVVDFGVARVGVAAQTLTRAGTLLGTIGYMAPEQAMSAKDVDERADIFALGCVLFECLTGRPAFAGPQPAVALTKLLQTHPPPVSQLRPGLPEALDKLVLRMLAKDRNDRPRDVAEVISALDAL